MTGRVFSEMDRLPYSVPFHTASSAALTLTALPAALGFATPSRTVLKHDLSMFTQARISAFISTVAGGAGSKLIAKYITAYSATATDWLDLGGSEISLALDQTTSTPYVGSWVNLAALAQADVFIAMMASGGDGIISPVLGSIHLQFK